MILLFFSGLGLILNFLIVFLSHNVLLYSILVSDIEKGTFSFRALFFLEIQDVIWAIFIAVKAHALMKI